MYVDDYKFHIHGKPAYRTLFLTQESRLRWKFPIDASCYWSITANWVTTSFYQFFGVFRAPDSTQINSTASWVELSWVGSDALNWALETPLGSQSIIGRHGRPLHRYKDHLKTNMQFIGLDSKNLRESRLQQIKVAGSLRHWYASFWKRLLRQRYRKA